MMVVPTKVFTYGDRAMTRDQVAHAMAATAHILEAASHAIVTGGDATVMFELASIMMREVTEFGRPNLKAIV